MCAHRIIRRSSIARSNSAIEHLARDRSNSMFVSSGQSLLTPHSDDPHHHGRLRASSLNESLGRFPRARDVDDNIVVQSGKLSYIMAGMLVTVAVGILIHTFLQDYVHKKVARP